MKNKYRLYLYNKLNCWDNVVDKGDDFHEQKTAYMYGYSDIIVNIMINSVRYGKKCRYN